MTAGIWTASLIPIPPKIAAAGLGACLIAAWILFGRRSRTALIHILIIPAVFFLGAGSYTLTARGYEACPLHDIREKDYLDFTGTLARSPERGRESDRLVLHVESVRIAGMERPVRGKLRVTVPNSSGTAEIRRLLAGEKVRISARLSQPREYRNFQSPDYALYLKTIGLHRTAFTKSARLVEKVGPGRAFNPRRWISRIRRALQDRIENLFASAEPPGLTAEGAVLEALLLGARERMDPDQTRSLRDSGLFHLFAISGAHIAILTFLLFSLFKAVRLGRAPTYISLIGFLVIFAALVEGRPSVLRASVMTAAFLVGKWLWKDVDLLNTLSISAFILLLFNPFQLFSLGFQLTFAATLSILLFYPRWIRVFPRLPLRISEIFVVSLCAQIGVLPIMASGFNRVTLAGPVLNFAALPLVAGILAGGYLLLALAPAAPVLAALLARGLSALVDGLFTVSACSQAAPWLGYRIPSPHALTQIAYAALLLALLLPMKKSLRPIVSALFIAVLAVLITYPFPPASGNLRVTFLDVGQGDSILVELPGRKTLLIDGGGGVFGDFDIGEQVVSPFLWRKGIRRIDYLALTHAHPDHMDGLEAVARNFRIGEFWETGRPAGDPASAIFAAGLPKSLPRRSFRRGDSLEVSGVRLRVFHPESESGSRGAEENNRSLVLKLTEGERSLLLTGDVEAEAEMSMLDDGLDLKSDVLKCPHHGSRSSSTPDFLRAAAPKIVVIPVGLGNRYRFPHADVLERYRTLGSAVYRTDLDGAVEIRFERDGLWVRTAAHPERRSDFFPAGSGGFPPPAQRK